MVYKRNAPSNAAFCTFCCQSQDPKKVIVVPSVWDMTVRILTTLYLQFRKSSVSLEGIQAGRLSHMLFLEMKDETTSWELFRGWNKELKESEFCYQEVSRMRWLSLLVLLEIQSPTWPGLSVSKLIFVYYSIITGIHNQYPCMLKSGGLEVLPFA